MVFCIVVLFSTTSIDPKYLVGENNVVVRFILEIGVPRTLVLTVSDSCISSAILSASPASTSTACKVHRESQGGVLLCDRFDSRRDNRHVLESADIFQRLFDYHSVEVPERFHIFDPDAMASHKGYSEFRCLQYEYKMAVP